MSCCGCIFRLLLLVLLLCFTACAILSSILPLFRYKVDLSDTTSIKHVVTYWHYQDTTISADGTVSKVRLNTREQRCSVASDVYYASAVLCVISAAFGALAAIFTVLWMLPCCRCLMGSLVFLGTVLAAACCLADFGMMLYAYRRGFCTDNLVYPVLPLKSTGYKVVEGFALLCAAGLGFIVMAVFEAVVYCCVTCCCSGSSARKKKEKKARAESPPEPTCDEAKVQEAASCGRDTSDNTPYANRKD